MTITKSKLEKFLFNPINTEKKPRTIFWFSLSMTLIVIYTIIKFRKVLAGEYSGEIIDDDARVYVFWLQKFLEPNLFTNDLIADYFQSVTPLGYTAFFRIMAVLGIKPIALTQILPPCLILIAVAYVFFIALEILPVPIVGFIAALSFWMASDIISSTPRGFVYAFFPAFIYYLLRRSWLPCLLTIALQGLFYSPYIFIMLGILLVRLFRFQGLKISLSPERKDYLFCFTGIAVAAISLIPYVIMSFEFSPIITAAEARALPEFWQGGRAPYFSDNPLDTFIFGWQSGIKPGRLFKPIWITWMSLLLPLIICFPNRFPLVNKLKQHASILLQIAIVSLGMFILAHIVFLKLYFPNRYTKDTLPLVIVIAASISIVIVFDAFFGWVKTTTFFNFSGQKIVVTGLFFIFVSYLLWFPTTLITKSPRPLYHIPPIEQFFARQPKDTLIASLENIVANNIPTFSRRSVLTGWEFANPYHLRYYNQIKQRTLDLIDAHYTDNLVELQNFINRYEVDFLVVRPSEFSLEFIDKNLWFRQWQNKAQEVKLKLNQDEVPALSKLSETCSTFTAEEWFVVSAKCISNAKANY